MEKLGLVDAALMKIQNNSGVTIALSSGEDYNGHKRYHLDFFRSTCTVHIFQV